MEASSGCILEDQVWLGKEASKEGLGGFWWHMFHPERALGVCRWQRLCRRRTGLIGFTLTRKGTQLVSEVWPGMSDSISWSCHNWKWTSDATANSAPSCCSIFSSSFTSGASYLSLVSLLSSDCEPSSPESSNLESELVLSAASKIGARSR